MSKPERDKRMKVGDMLVYMCQNWPYSKLFTYVRPSEKSDDCIDVLDSYDRIHDNLHYSWFYTTDQYQNSIRAGYIWKK